MSDRNAQDVACREYESLSRRGFFDRALPFAAALAATQLLPKVAFGRRRGSNRDVLVTIFLRGGMDGLTTCVPYGDPDLYTARPLLAIPPPGNPGGAIDLDGFFGLHPSAAPLLTPYQAGRLAIVHASGSTDPTRSHFEAFKFMEYGIPEQPTSSIQTGWLARHLDAVSPSGPGFFRGVALTSPPVMPKTLNGAPATLPIEDLDQFTFPGSGSTAPARRQVLTDSYAATREPLKSAAQSTFATLDLLDQIDFAGYTPANGAVYPDTLLGRQLKSAAALIKADVGVETVMAEIGGWDLHAQLLPNMPILLDDLTRTLEAFYLDNLGGLDKLVVVAMSEFGRRVAENASAGLDHGHGNCMLVMGGHIAGGQVLTTWPGLAPGNLDSGLDLAITIDYRDILGEILSLRLEDASLSDVFPNYTPTFRGIVV
jgi:uncharacterized protein (DUF1501 family)